MQKDENGVLVNAPKGGTRPPQPPDLSWISNEILKNRHNIKDKPAALILMTDSGSKGSVALALEKSGYQIEYAETADDALQKLTSTIFAVVALHIDFERGMSFEESKVHNYLAKLPMKKRRRIFYILLGPAFKTLYKLQALSLSANLVVNIADIEFMSTIFKKSFLDYNELFGPLLQIVEMYS